MRVTSKGQVTIPQSVREQMRLVPGVEVEFHITKKGVLLTKAKGKETFGKRIVEHMRNKASVSMSTDEIMALTRGA